MLNILSFTSLYPNSAQPHHGIFVENRLRHLAQSGEAQITVVAPVPFFPSEANLFGRYGVFARVPPNETRYGLSVLHPRYAVVPKIGMTVAPMLMVAGVSRAMTGLTRGRPRFDVLDAHYFYPDGVAAAVFARRLGLPLMITARGSDITEIARHALPRRQILWAARQAGVIATVCEALKSALIDLGVDRACIHVLRNGVDLKLFKYVPGGDTGTAGLGPLLLSVGHLIPRKGHDLVLQAMRQLPGCRLMIVGEGPQAAALKDLAADLGLGERVRFVGAVPHEDLARLYSAADILVLASSREGWANVLLEALACGTPVVATDVFGTKEVVQEPIAGELVRQRTALALAEAIKRQLNKPVRRDRVRAYAERFSWRETTERQLALLAALADTRRFRDR